MAGWILVEDPVFSGDGWMGIWHITSRGPRTTDYGQRTSKNFIFEKTDFRTIFISKCVESIVYTNLRTARRLEWTD